MRVPHEEKEQFISIFQAPLALIHSKEMELLRELLRT